MFLSIRICMVCNCSINISCIMVEINPLSVYVLINISIICKRNTNGRSVTLRNWFNKKQKTKKTKQTS